MAHQNKQSAYLRLIDRLNRFPQGAPPSELLVKILKILFTEKEAELASLLPIKPFTAKKAARIWKIHPIEARKRLDALASRAILLDIHRGDEIYYVLPPPMAGFFEFSLMRIRNDIDQKALGELFYEYLNIEEDFIRKLFTDGRTQLGRAYVQEPALSPENALHVLDYEKASHVIATSFELAVSICYCRHKMFHVGKDCDAPKDICLTLNTAAASLIRNGHARKAEKAEAMDLLKQAYEHNLVQFGENVQNGVNFICNCCGCCCEAMLAARKFAFMTAVHTTNFIPEIKEDNCNGCGKCVSACPVEAMTLVSANDNRRPKKKKARLNEPTCLGCGVCVRVCPNEAISLLSRPKRVVTPVDSVFRTVLMAVERGKLQNMIFDNHVLWSHRAMAAVLGAILRLPLAKKAMATDQFRSRYLAAVIDAFEVG